MFFLQKRILFVYHKTRKGQLKMENKLMTMREYATSRGISYEAVRRKVIRNRDELNLCKKGRTTYLTQQAIKFLDAHKRNFSHPAYKPDAFSDLEELIVIQAKEIDWYKNMLETQHVMMDILKKELDDMRSLAQNK